MSYSIIGAGKVGQALARAFARKKIEVAIASRRSPEALAPVAKAIGPTIIPKSLQDAVKAEIVLLAIPFGTQKDVAKAAKSWQGKIVIDVTNAYVSLRKNWAIFRPPLSYPRPFPAQDL